MDNPHSLQKPLVPRVSLWQFLGALLKRPATAWNETITRRVPDRLRRRPRAGSEPGQRREPRVGLEARPQAQRDARLAREQRVPRRRVPPPLRQRVQREAAGPVEPQLVAGAGVEGEERVGIARGAVAEAGAVAQRAGGPDRGAGGLEQGAPGG